jgi:hypothetical protein
VLGKSRRPQRNEHLVVAPPKKTIANGEQAKIDSWSVNKS